MNIFSLLKLLKGGNIWETLSKILTIAGSITASTDSNNTGIDDDLASIMLSASEGLDAYNKKDFNKVGRIIDGIIVALQGVKLRLNITPAVKKVV